VKLKIEIGGTFHHPIQGGVEILGLVSSCYGNRDELQPGGPLGLNADFTFTKAGIQSELKWKGPFRFLPVSTSGGGPLILVEYSDLN